MVRLLNAAAVVLLLGVAHAQPAAPPVGGNVVTMDPTEIDSFSCRFVGRTLAAIGSQPVGWLDVEDITVPGTDADPDAIITASTTSGSDATFTLAPSARQGNTYQIRVRPLDSENNRPLCVVRLQVRDGGLQP